MVATSVGRSPNQVFITWLTTTGTPIRAAQRLSTSHRATATNGSPGSSTTSSSTSRTSRRGCRENRKKLTADDADSADLIFELFDPSNALFKYLRHPRHLRLNTAMKPEVLPNVEYVK